MPFTVKVKDAVRNEIDRIGGRYGMNREQVVTAAISAFKFLDDRYRGNFDVMVVDRSGSGHNPYAETIDWVDLIEHAKNS